MSPKIGLACILCALLTVSASIAEELGDRGDLVVTATAYNNVPEQTNDQPDIAAWGDRLEPGMKVIAVSRDLLELGLERNTRVRIEGFEGEYVVLDKMARRWRNTIDIYMGKDIAAARQFGRRTLRIEWNDADPEEGSLDVDELSLDEAESSESETQLAVSDE